MNYGCIVENNTEDCLVLSFFNADNIDEGWLGGDNDKLIHYGNHVIDGWVELDKDGIAPLTKGSYNRREGNYDSEGNEIFNSAYNSKFVPMTVSNYVDRAEKLADSYITAKIKTVEDVLNNFKSNVVGYYGTIKSTSPYATNPFCKMKPCNDIIPEKNNTSGDRIMLSGSYFEYVVFIRDTAHAGSEPMIISYMLCSLPIAINHINEFTAPLTDADLEPDTIFYRCYYSEYNRDTDTVDSKYKDFNGKAALNDANKFYSGDYATELVRYKWGIIDKNVTNNNRSKELVKPLNYEYSPTYIKQNMTGVKEANAEKIIEKVGIDNIVNIMKNKQTLTSFRNFARSCNDYSPDDAADTVLMFCEERDLLQKGITVDDALDKLKDIDDKVAK